MTVCTPCPNHADIDNSASLSRVAAPESTVLLEDTIPGPLPEFMTAVSRDIFSVKPGIESQGRYS